MGREKLNDHRRMWKYMVFGILTFGIYDIYNDWTMINDLNTACAYKETDKNCKSPHYLVRLLLSVITLGIYGFVWFYQQGNRIKRVGEEYGVKIDEKGSTYVLWMLFGSLLFGIGPFIAIYFLICNVNKLCAAYNASIEMESERNRQIEKSQDSDKTPQYIRATIDEQKTLRAKNKGTLHFISGEYSGADIVLNDGEEIVLGRNGEMSQLVFQDSDISRKHCAIRYSASDGYFYITDYSSLGTYMNGSSRLMKDKVTKCTVGTKITLGQGQNELILQ